MLLLDPSAGTHVLGSRFGRLETTYRDRMGDDYVHEVAAKLVYDGDWLLAVADQEIQRYYAWHLQKRFGIQLGWKSKSGAHVSVVRGEAPLANADRWGHDAGRAVTLRYTHEVYTNGLHWWLNAFSDELAAVREFYGFDPGKRWFHLTIGRLG